MECFLMDRKKARDYTKSFVKRTGFVLWKKETPLWRGFIRQTAISAYSTTTLVACIPFGPFWDSKLTL
jgi:hypothetical protein